MTKQENQSHYRLGIGPSAIVILTAALITLFQTDLSRAFAQTRMCWIVDTQTCNTPRGDCINRQTGALCHKCDAATTLESTCVWASSGGCSGNGTSVTCGLRFRGECDWLGMCDGNTFEGNCVLEECNYPT